VTSLKANIFRYSGFRTGFRVTEVTIQVGSMTHQSVSMTHPGRKYSALAISLYLSLVAWSRTKDVEVYRFRSAFFRDWTADYVAAARSAMFYGTSRDS
jgi:hypothetical protein